MTFYFLQTRNRFAIEILPDVVDGGWVVVGGAESVEKYKSYIWYKYMNIYLRFVIGMCSTRSNYHGNITFQNILEVMIVSNLS